MLEVDAGDSRRIVGLYMSVLSGGLVTLEEMRM